jgi:hypothetical protein
MQFAARAHTPGREGGRGRGRDLKVWDLCLSAVHAVRKARCDLSVVLMLSHPTPPVPPTLPSSSSAGRGGCLCTGQGRGKHPGRAGGKRASEGHTRLEGR